MADFNNFSEINENFSTIKTLLNSIRAQGILNTSDVDKLLTGIYTKLEKINTEEDIDLIKVFLSDLKSNLEERHGVLVSKFGAIEALFSNLLKNSAEMPKSAELKELFDIVATNLSVFSREVVSQKESLTDITLRLDALRSDDSQKKEIIKNIGLLRPDLEKLNNGFDSIVLSLNENFKTIIKTITTLDKTEYLDKFADALSNMETSSNTVLSALQMLDKKTSQVETALQNLATQDDIKIAKDRLSELTVKNNEMNHAIGDLSSRYVKIDNLAEKIDASVNIIASLKSVLEEADNKNTSTIIDRLNELETNVKTIASNERFDEFKSGLTSVLKNILDNTLSIEPMLSSKGTDIVAEVNQAIQKLATLQDANITRVLNELSTSADALNSKLAQTQSSISGLCEKQFESVFESISGIKTAISQMDENSISANNAIFSNITDRLAIFENSLKVSLETQERNSVSSSSILAEQIKDIKNISSVLDYKMDSNVLESGNVKKELESLKGSLDGILALDFVGTISNLKTSLQTSKQELMGAVITTNSETSKKIINDLYSKHELLINKLDSIESNLIKTQGDSLATLKTLLENFSSSLVNVLSQINEQRVLNDNGINTKLDEISTVLKENSINYVESVRETIDVIRIQVENNLNSIETNTAEKLDSIKKSVSDNTNDLKEGIKNSYEKLLEIQNGYKEIKDILNLNSVNSSDRIESILNSALDVKNDFESNIITLKSALLEKITNFKQELAATNEEKIGELKNSLELLHRKNSQEVTDLLAELALLMSKFTSEDQNVRTASLAKILDNFVALKDYLSTLNNNYTGTVVEQVNKILEDFNGVKTTLSKIDESIDSDLTRQLSIIESNFESLVSQITILFDKLDEKVAQRIDKEFTPISQAIQDSISQKLEEYKLKIEDSCEKLQAKAEGESGFLKDRIEDLNSVLLSVLKEQNQINYNQISEMTVSLKSVLDENLKLTASDYAAFKENLAGFAKNIETNNATFTQNFKVQLDEITKYIDSVLDAQADEIKARNEEILVKQTELRNSQLGLEEKIETAKLDTLRTMAELSVVTAEQLEEIKTETFNAVEEMQAQSKNQFDVLQKTHDSIIQNIDSNVAGLSNLCSQNKALIEKTEESAIERHESALIKADDILNTVKNIEESGKNAAIGTAVVQNDIAALTRLVEENKDRLNKLDMSIMNNSSALNALSEDVSAGKQSNIEELQKIVEENKTRLNNLDSAIANNSIALSALTEEVTSGKLSNLTEISKLVEENKSRLNNLDSAIANNSIALNALTEEVTSGKLSNFTELAKLVEENKTNINNLNSTVMNGVSTLNSLIAEVSAGELQAIDSYASDILEQIELEKENVKACKDLIIEFTKQELDSISKNIEKETDVVIGELIEQFDLIKNSQADDFRVLTTRIEELLSSEFYNNVEDLKSYIDLKSDTTVLNSKLDSIREVSNDVQDRLSEFDSKYEELKQIVNSYANSYDSLQNVLKEEFEQFKELKDVAKSQFEELTQAVDYTATATNDELRKLSEGFENLRSQISNKSFDEAFQASINNQIENIEALVNSQMGYIQDINDLCAINLPEVSELNIIVKHSVIDILNNLSDKINSQDIAGDIEEEFKQFKTDIITQFLNVFNQISFITEQEEILDFVNAKHEELITVLSHIVTTTSDIGAIKENVNVVDIKIDNIKEDIELINEKITAIMSSDGDIDYVYSLQDLESDIANLRIELNSIKQNDHAEELKSLIASTNDIYSLVENIKAEYPNKKDFEEIAEDIVSISTRTNKLLLASDESYKTLQDNLQDFKLVISDLDERTKHFAQNSGMDKVNAKLNSINSMMENGAKTNQVFNQVFEYLAEWVDNASVQINSITDKVETLDELAQIKDMIEDLKAGAEDNTETVELIEALGEVFDKQTKRISSLEAKLDRMIVETTINNKNKIDLTPMEDTLNRFLVAMDEKITSQQEKINSLETKLAGALEIIEGKDTAQLTKKVGGMDRQIAKLNKSIEKIASHVIDK